MARPHRESIDRKAPAYARALKDRKRDARRWSRHDFLTDLHRATAPITEAINADPKEAELLAKSRRQVREGEVHWGVEDEEDKDDDSG